MTTKLGFSRLTFSRIKDLVNFPSPAALNEITYVASATNFRRCLLNQYGDGNIDIEHEIDTNPDAMATYLGYRRFLVSDLKYIQFIGFEKGRVDGFTELSDRLATTTKDNLHRRSLLRCYIGNSFCVLAEI